MTPFDDLAYLVNHVILGEQPTIEDFILLIGTLVAFIAFILWCCFPIQPRDASYHRQYTCKSVQSSSIDGTTQMHNNYSKSGPPVHNDYSLRTGGHVYHCCT